MISFNFDKQIMSFNCRCGCGETWWKICDDLRCSILKSLSRGWRGPSCE